MIGPAKQDGQLSFHAPRRNSPRSRLVELGESKMTDGPAPPPDLEPDYKRYRRLLAEADDEPKRLALINLLIEERSKDKLASQLIRQRLEALMGEVGTKAKGK